MATTDLNALRYGVTTPADHSDARAGVLSGDFELDVRPFGFMPVHFEVDEDGSLLAVELLTGSYGVGPSLDRAFAALHDAILRHYHFLVRTGPDLLSDRLRTQLEALEAKAVASRSLTLNVGTRTQPDSLRQLALAA